MYTKLFSVLLLIVAMVLASSAPLFAAEKAMEKAAQKAEQPQTQFIKEIKLPAAQTDGGMPLMQALKNRQSLREYSNKPLSQQTLANLLWAADGVNRPDGKRTAPTAMNIQEIDVYVAANDGLYLYDAKAHSLKQIVAEDLRGATGSQPFVKEAAINLVYVADFAKMRGDEASKTAYANADTGFISQNVYLFCASEKLNTVVRGSFDKVKLPEAMKLRADQKVILVQTVGYPKEQ